MYGQPVHSNFTDVPQAKGIEAANTIATFAAELKSVQAKGSRLQINRPEGEERDMEGVGGARMRVGI